MRHRLLQTVRLWCAVSTAAMACAIAACSDSSTGTTTPLVDDRLVAFVSDSGNDCCNHSSIFIMHADGSHTTRVTSGEYHDETPAWSSDGSTIAFFSNRTPTGIWAVNADGTNLRSLVSAPFNLPGEPAWSPDGRSLAFSTFYLDSLDNFVDVIELADANGSGAHQLMTTAKDVGSPSWSPGSARIVFAGGEVEPHLYVINADGAGEHQITFAYDFQPKWSPDGNHIAFSTLDTTSFSLRAQITVVREDGSNRRAITSGAVDRTPSWSPDGQQIAFERLERDSTTDTTLTPHRIYRMNADGSHQRPMSMDTVTRRPGFNSWAPAWRPAP